MPLNAERLAGQEGFEPPTYGFGDRRSAVGATGLFRLHVVRMLPAPGAEFPSFEPFLLGPAIFLGTVIASLAT